jgi:hypothetical protein
MNDNYQAMCEMVSRAKPFHIGESSSTFWRKDDPIIDTVHIQPDNSTRKVLTVGGFWEYQRRWWELPNFIKALVGGFGSGKTLVGCKRIISSALQNAPVPVATVSPTFPLARHTVISTIQELLAGKRANLGRRFWWTFNQSSHEFTIKYRGRRAKIIVYSGELPKNLRGPNLGAAYIDEPFIQDQEVFKQMIARVRHPDADYLEVFLTGTPEQLNWGYDLCIGEDKEYQDVGVVHASTRENRVLDSAYIKRLEAAFSDKEVQAYVDGGFVNLSVGNVYHAFDPNNNVATLPMPEGAELGAGMDFNVDPMSAAVFWFSGNHIHFFREYELENADTEFMCDTLSEAFGDSLRVVYPDASGASRKSSSPGGKTDFWYLRKAGYTVDAPPSNPHRRDRYNAVNGKLKARDGSITCTVAPECRNLVKYLSTYTYANMNKTDGKKMSHLLDAFSYPIARLFPVDKESLTGARRITGV